VYYSKSARGRQHQAVDYVGEREFQPIRVRQLRRYRD
jgi:hypothetical protein